MKGIVLEIKNNEAAILSDDGAVSKVKNKNYEIGQVIILKQNKKFKSKFIAGAAGLVAAMAISATGAFAYYTPTSYVSLDVNPSIEYSVNMFDRVLTVKAVNDDAKEILVDLDLNHKDITKAVEKTIDELIEAGYLTKDEDGGVIIAVSNSDEDKAEALVEEIEEETQKHIDEKGETAKLEVEAVGKARVEEARKLGVTPGKLNLVQKLKASASDPDGIEIEEWLNKSVKEINKTIKEYRQELKNTGNANDDTDEIKDEDNNDATEAKNDKNANKPVKDEKVKKDNSNKPVKDDKQIKEEYTKADEDMDDDETAAAVENDDANKKEKTNNGKSQKNRD